MIRATIIYYRKGSSTFDYDYYRTQHMPLSGRMPHTLVTEIDEVVSQEGPIHCIGYHYYNTLEEAKSSFLGPGSAPLAADVPNYYSGGAPTIVFSKVDEPPNQSSDANKEKAAIREAIIYEKRDSSTFDYQYYKNSHMANIVKNLSPVRVEMDEVVGTPEGDSAPIHCIGYLYYSSMDNLEKDSQTPAGKEGMADIPNYYSGGDPADVISKLVRVDT